MKSSLKNETTEKVTGLMFLSEQLQRILKSTENMSGVRAEVEIPYRIAEEKKLETMVKIATKIDEKRV